MSDLVVALVVLVVAVVVVVVVDSGILELCGNLEISPRTAMLAPFELCWAPGFWDSGVVWKFGDSPEDCHVGAL